MTAEEILNQGQDKIKELTAGVDMMKLTLAIEEEFNSLGSPKVSIYINGDKEPGGSALCINRLWDDSESELQKLVEQKIEERKKAAKYILMKAGIGIDPDAEGPDGPQIEITDAEPDPEVAPVQPKEYKVDSSTVIPDYLLREEYFKQGKTVKKIAEDYNVGVHGLYKRVEKMKQQKEVAAKECASSQR